MVVSWKLHHTGISMTADYQCGYTAEHVHTDACYTKTLVCQKEETDGQEGHTHTESCYEEKTTLNCEKEEHVHGQECYDEDGTLICEKEEHTHTENCYYTEREQICGKEEQEPVPAHHHTEECYKTELACTIPEHTHTVECLIDETGGCGNGSGLGKYDSAESDGKLGGKCGSDCTEPDGIPGKPEKFQVCR